MLELLIAFFRPNLDRVLGKFDKTIADLEKVALHQTDVAAKKAKAAESALAAQALAISNAARAVEVKANIKGLLGH